MEEMKKLLSQLADLIVEEKELQERIRKTKRQIERIGDEVVSDTVQASTNDMRYASHTVTIMGIESDKLIRKKAMLETFQAKLERLHDQILVKTIMAFEYIESVDDSRMRTILTLRYVERKTWVQIAHRMKAQSADSVRKEHDRFFQK